MSSFGNFLSIYAYTRGTGAWQRLRQAWLTVRQPAGIYGESECLLPPLVPLAIVLSRVHRREHPGSGRTSCAQTVNLRTAADSRSLLPENDTVNQAYPPTFFLTVDRHGNFRFVRWVIDRILEYKKVGTEMRNGQDVAVDT
jgi:hypothetical protein